MHNSSLPGYHGLKVQRLAQGDHFLRCHLSKKDKLGLPMLPVLVGIQQNAGRIVPAGMEYLVQKILQTVQQGGGIGQKIRTVRTV